MNHLSSFAETFRKSSTTLLREMSQPIFPIRSCLKIDDELISNFGHPLRKTVTFSCYIRVFPALTPLEPSSTSTKVQRQPKQSSYKSVPTQRKGLQKVSFSPFYTTIEPNGRSYTSLVTLEEEDDCWKPGALDGEPYYKMNCRNLVCF